MTKKQIYIDIGLCVVWTALTVVGIYAHWGAWWISGFAFALGERWGRLGLALTQAVDRRKARRVGRRV